MSDHSKIEWTETTWNPIAGCDIVSPGCTNCYAMRRVAPRLSGNPATPHYHGTVKPSKAGPVWTGKIGIADDKVLTKPLRWKRPRMIFVNSTSDLFHPAVPDEVIDKIFAFMALSPQHTFQVLTKRSARMRDYLERMEDCFHGNQDLFGDRWGTRGARLMDDSDTAFSYIMNRPFPLPNVWLGVSVEDQKRADERIPDLLATPAAIRFLSVEPLIGPVDLWDARYPAPGGGKAGAISVWQKERCLDWVIVGGESGSGARPMHPDWARSIKDQCAAADVAFFFKQWGEWIDADQWLDMVEAGPSQLMVNGERWRPARPLNFAEAETLAVLTGRMCNGEPMIERLSDGTTFIKVGKTAAGRLLDGVEHNAMPAISEVPFR